MTLVAAATALVVACAPRAGERSPDAPIPAGEALYLDRCGRCHVPFPPWTYSDREWASTMADMASEAGLSAPEADLVLRWLVGHND